MKDTDSQHGGEDNKRYEILFEGEYDRSPIHGKKRSVHKPENMLGNKIINDVISIITKTRVTESTKRGVKMILAMEIGKMYMKQKRKVLVKRGNGKDRHDIGCKHDITKC